MNHLITSPSDIYYLTGVRSHDPGEILIILEKKEEIDSVTPVQAGVHQGDQGWIPAFAGMTRKTGIIFCDPRTAALFDAEKFQIIDDRKKWGEGFKSFASPPSPLPRPAKGGSRKGELATDPDFLTQTLREKIEWYGVKLSMQPSPIVKARLLKKTEEIELIMESQRLNKKVYEMIVPFLVPWVTESSIARKIQILQLELGADGPSFPPIVAFAENTAIPHHSPTEKVLRVWDPVLLDMGLVYKWYCSDMTRCLVLRDKEKVKEKEEQRNFDKNDTNAPGEVSESHFESKGGRGDSPGNFEEIYRLLQEITAEIISWAKPGMRVADLDKKAREMMGEFEPYFTHSLGHGVGIDIHEAPHISTRSEEILEPGMVITIEPGIYSPQNFLQVQSAKCKVQNDGSSFNTNNQQPITNNHAFGARYEEMVVVDKDWLLLL